jgi:hypothetical protein
VQEYSNILSFLSFKLNAEQYNEKYKIELMLQYDQYCSILYSK